MSSEWKTSTLGECVTFLSGSTPSKNNPTYWGPGISWISAKDMKSFWVEAAEDTLTPAGVDVASRIVGPGTTLLLTRGMTLHNDVPIVRTRFPAAFNQDVKAVIPREAVLTDYVPYLLLGNKPRLQGLVDSAGHGTGRLNSDSLRALAVEIPPLNEQQELAYFFSALDDRITLLRETNATLEAIAQALFKSWFVDFDPVRAKQAGRAPEGMDEATAALFPDTFEESELGLVPKGWRVVTLSDVCTVTIGGLWGKDTKEDVDLVPAISLRGVDLENLRSLGFAVDAPVRWVKPAAMEKRRVSESEVLIASSGAGPCGRPLWAGANFESLYGIPVIFSNFVKRLGCGNPSKAIYVDRLLAEMRASREIWNYINGTSIPNLDDKLLLATKKVVIPSDDVLAAFEQIARAIYSRLYSQQAQTLATLRDTLLPRLISGQLRLPEAEALIEESAA